MLRAGVRLLLALSLALTVVLASAARQRGNPSPLQTEPQALPYRSPGGLHKVIVYKSQTQILESVISAGGNLSADYDTFSLYTVPAAGLDNFAHQNKGFALRDDLNLVLLRAGAIDTTVAQPYSAKTAAEAAATSTSDHRLLLVQVKGPVKLEWLNWIRAKGEIVTYVPNNAFIVRTDNAKAVGLWAARPEFIQWVGEYQPSFKISPDIAGSSEPELRVTVQLVNSADSSDTAAEVVSLSNGEVAQRDRVLNFLNLHLEVSRENLSRIAAIQDVVWIEPMVEPMLLDERQGLIAAGYLSNEQFLTRDYLAWLASKDLSGTPDFLIDLTDSGIDRGFIAPPNLHKVFLDSSGQSRVVYARMAAGASSGPANDTTGHGTINASILAGFDQSTAFPDGDELGLRYGIGMAPFARFGVTKVFNPAFVNPDYAAMVSAAYDIGARVSNNSWGSQVNEYTTTSQQYDAMVRDAQPGTAGNQQMTFVFSAGNGGPGGNITAPGTAKNVITVGASQGYRPDGTDGCGVTPAGASDINSIAPFSAGGPVQDGRIKPDLVAPGTHIEGALSQDPANTASDLCGPEYSPAGQTLYTWSSGTSHAAPAVTGAAALTMQYFEQSTGTLPSPAMVKAFLLNSTDYMSGDGAGVNLPGVQQGWGRLDIGRAFDGVPRTIVDQTKLLTATGQTFVLHGRIADPSKPVRVTLAWTDAPGSPAANPVVNDLDLQVNQGGETYLGNYILGQTSLTGGSPDRRNNVESVWFNAGRDGEITVTVTAANLAGDGVPGNSSPTDQDFALVVYNATPDDGSVDGPPSVSLTFPSAGSEVASGRPVSIQWQASDDREITRQEVQLSTDGGLTFDTIATPGGNDRSFEWQTPSILTQNAQIQIRVFDGVNLPVCATSNGNFSIVTAPPDSAPPQVQFVSPSGGATIGGGAPVTISWNESDDVGVVRRLIEFSATKGKTYQTVADILGGDNAAPNAVVSQTYQWNAPTNLNARKGRFRITVYDAVGNSAESESSGKIQAWPLPIISRVNYSGSGQNAQLTITGSGFRQDQSQVFVNDQALGGLNFSSPSSSLPGTYNKIVSADKRLNQKLPPGASVVITIRVASTGQVSSQYSFTRPN